MLVTEKILVRTGEISPVSGYFIYKRNADAGVVPCLPVNQERVIVLEKGDIVPGIFSCSNHSALYKLVAEKS
jgi:hypothetical protein